MASASIALSFYDTLLHWSDIEILEGPYWLNDTIISFYFQYLEKIVFKSAEDMLFVSPEVTQCVKMVERGEVKTFFDPLGAKKKKYIFFALNDHDNPEIAGGSHWSLLVYSKPEKCIFHLDSLNGTNEDEYWEFLKNLFSYLGTDGGPIDLVEKECLQQSNGYDCGIHVLCNAERLGQCAYNNEDLHTCDMLVEINPSIKRKEIISILQNLCKTE